MILTNELKGKIVSKGFTQQDIAKYLGISTRTFNQRLQEEIVSFGQIFKMIKLLEIENPMSIFFAENVT